MSRICDLAQAVTDALNGYAFSQSFIANRKHVPLEKRSELPNGYTVDVVPRSRESEIAARKTEFERIKIDIGIIRPVPPTDIATADQACGLAEEIQDFLKKLRMGDYRCRDVVYEVPHIPEWLMSQNVFVALVTATYETLLSVGQ